MVPVFTNNCLEVPKIMNKLFYKPLDGKTKRSFRSMTALWCIVWVRQSLHLRFVFWKQKSYVVWYHIDSVAITMVQTKCRLTPIKAMRLKKFLCRGKVLSMMNICDTILIQNNLSNRSPYSGQIAKKYYYPNLNM